MTEARRPPGTAFVITHESDPCRKTRSTSLIALAVTRSLGRRGVPVVRIHPNRLEHSLGSRYCTAVAVSPDMYEAESPLVGYLLELAAAYEGPRVLIPASDDCAQFLGMHRDTLDSAYAVCAAAPAVTGLVMNKQRQYETAQRLGVPIPETYFPKSTVEFEALLERLGNYPYVIKPLVAHRWRLASMKRVSKGRKALRADSPDELRRAYAALGDDQSRVMVQEVIGGRDEQLFTFLACVGESGEPLAYCVRSKIRQLPLDFGYCTMTVSCHDDTVVEQSLRLLRGIGFAGICGIEYKYDAATAEYKLIEINARPVNTIGLAAACGVDIPFIAYCALADHDVRPVTTWRDGVRWHRIWYDFLAVRELRARGGPGYGEWMRSLWGGDQVEAVFAWDDLKPVVRYFGGLFYEEFSAQMRKRLPMARDVQHAA